MVFAICLIRHLLILKSIADIHEDVQILIKKKVPPVSYEVLADLKNIERRDDIAGKL